MDIRELFATNLRRIRHERDISQEELADLADVDRAHVSKIERELVFVGIEIVGKFAKVLGVEPMEFFRPPEKKARAKK